MKKYLIIFVVLYSLYMISCKSQQNKTENAQYNSVENKQHSLVVDEVAEEANFDIIAVESKNQFAELNKFDSDFAFQFFKLLSKENKDKNLSISPTSLQLAMSMVYVGANGLSRREISEVFGFSFDNQKFLETMGSYNNYLSELQNDTDYQFALANKIFIEQTYKVLNQYSENIKKYFGGAFEHVDFIKRFKLVEKQINTWVENQTKERIKNLIPAGTLDDNTRLVLVNTIYYKSDWKFTFNEELTQKKDFHLNKSSKVLTDFMIQRQKNIPYFENSKFQVLELPYSNGKFSMIILLPKNSSDTEIFNLIPDYKSYLSMVSGLKNQYVYFEIPKFKIESNFDFVESLKSMGIRNSFTDFADFSGISGSNDLKISKILQKVFFEIDEKGSEAAAATAIIMVLTSAGPNMKEIEPKKFIANRPFIFILKENKYHTPLFMGHFVKP